MVSSEPEGAARQFVAEDVPVGNTLMMITLVVAGWSVLVLMSSWTGSVRLLAFGLGAPLLAVLAWLWAPPRRLWLEQDVLVAKEPWREQRLPLREVRSARTRWMPYKGQDLVFVGRGQTIRLLSLGEDTAALRFELGRRLLNNGPSVLEDRGARALLGLSTEQG
jgi:hypothetical protein